VATTKKKGGTLFKVRSRLRKKGQGIKGTRSSVKFATPSLDGGKGSKKTSMGTKLSGLKRASRRQRRRLKKKARAFELRGLVSQAAGKKKEDPLQKAWGDARRMGTKALKEPRAFCGNVIQGR